VIITHMPCSPEWGLAWLKTQAELMAFISSDAAA